MSSYLVGMDKNPSVPSGNSQLVLSIFLRLNLGTLPSRLLVLRVPQSCEHQIPYEVR